MFLGQAGMFLSLQARRSSATRSSTSDLTVRSLKHEKECETKNCHQDAIKRNMKPKFRQQTTFGTLFMEMAKKRSSAGELLHKNCRNVFSKTCVNFERCYSNRGWRRLKNICFV